MTTDATNLSLAQQADQPPTTCQTIQIPISPGELIDKITILEIKTDRISDGGKLQNVRHELTLLGSVREQQVAASQRLSFLTDELRRVNESLWQIEDEIRDCEREKRFDEQFIALARAVYHHNDRRADLKRQINTLLGSEIIEEKSYRPYADAA